MDTPPLSARLEALLFSEGGPMTFAKLGKFLGAPEADVRAAARELGARQGGGLTVIMTDTDVALAVSKDAAPTVEAAYVSETERDIGDAGLEVLAILLYRGASTRSTIDYIRGVNSSFSLRSLLSRGLVERLHNPDDSREYLYRASVGLLSHVGASSSAELPEYATITSELAAFETEHAHAEGDTTGGDADA